MEGYPLLNIFLTLMWFFLWVLWLVLLFRVVVDIFRDDTLSGAAKAGWTLFVVVLPLLGVFVYLVVRGKGMGQREVAALVARESRSYGATGPEGRRSGGPADELIRLADLKNHGELTEEEYKRAKAHVLSR